MEKRKKYIVSLTTGHSIGGEASTKKSRASRKKGRTSKTYNNKLTKIKAKYNKYSKSAKFKEKYPTFESWLAKFTMKQVGGRSEENSYNSINRSEAKKKGMWGL